MEPFKKDPACVECLSHDMKIELIDPNLRVTCLCCGHVWMMVAADCDDRKKDLIMEKKE